MKNSIIFIFLDGLGLGKADQNNPLFTHGLPGLESIVGCKLLAGVNIKNDSFLLKGIDACLGIDGIPQSATGQTALFTGINAPSLLGYHLPAFPNEQLIEVIREHSILKQVKCHGLHATFSNAYSDPYFTNTDKCKHTHSVTTHCVFAANISFRTINDLIKNEAIYWDITRSHLVQSKKVSTISPKEAGQHLSKLAGKYDLTLFECFETDIVGHSGSIEKAIELIAKIDEFICEVIENLPKNVSMLLCSDHGNIEDLSMGTHTLNSVPLLVIGQSASHFSNVTRIDQVTPAIIDLLCRNTAVK